MTKEIPGQAVRQNRRQESRAGAGKAEQVEDAADTEYDQAAERLEPVGGPESTEAAERLEQASRPEIGQMAVQIQQATEPGLPGFAQATEVFAHAPGPGLPIPKSAEATPTPPLRRGYTTGACAAAAAAGAATLLPGGATACGRDRSASRIPAYL